MNWTVADYTNNDGITWVFDADGRTVAGAYSHEVAELIAKAPGLLACAEHYAADSTWDRFFLLEDEMAALFYQAGARTDGSGTRDGWAVAREALKGGENEVK